MLDSQTAPYGALLLRVAMGLLFIMHGAYLKLFIFTMPGTGQFFQSLGLPGWFAWLVLLYETIGGIMLIVGIYTRWVAIFLGVHLLFAAYLGHWGNGWLFTNQGGGWEFPAFWAIACFALALIGDGAMATRHSDTRQTAS
jgi:putative oxidoreductase